LTEKITLKDDDNAECRKLLRKKLHLASAREEELSDSNLDGEHISDLNFAKQ
jgi:hypothetical protein